MKMNTYILPLFISLFGPETYIEYQIWLIPWRKYKTHNLRYYVTYDLSFCHSWNIVTEDQQGHTWDSRYHKNIL